MRMPTTTLSLLGVFALLVAAMPAPEPRSAAPVPAPAPAPAPDRTKGGDSAGCFVIQIAFTEFDHNFTLVVQNPSYPHIHGRTVSFLGNPLALPGDFRAGLFAHGSVPSMSFRDGRLAIHGGHDIGYLRVPRKTVRRQLAFTHSPGKPLEAFGAYSCDARGRLQTHLTPVAGPSSYTFCVAKELNGGEYSLYVRETSMIDKACIDVVAVVAETARPPA